MADDHNPLQGLDEPRPLSSPQRDRLEDALVGGDLAARLALAAAPRPLPPALRASLLAQLARPARWRSPAVLGGAAAAGVVVLLVALLAGPSERVVTPTALPSPTAEAAPGAVTGGAAGPVVGGRPSPSVVLPRAAPEPTGSRSGVSAPADRGGAAGPAAGPPVSPAPAPLEAPVVSALSPASGPLTGGNVVVVTGERLGPSPEVWFGTVRADRVEVVSSGELRVVAPPHLPGEVDVVVRTSSGSSEPGPGSRYRYGA